MSSSANIPSGHEAGNNTTIGNTSGLPITDQSALILWENHLTNCKAGQSTKNNDGKEIMAIDDGGSWHGQDNVAEGSGRRPKRYHRHSRNQIIKLESFFQNCSTPNDKQRRLLGLEVGLEPDQVKYWFQNKRTQAKLKHERKEYDQNQADIERLLAENARLKTMMRNSYCVNCRNPNGIGGLPLEENNLCVENSRLRAEISRLKDLIAKYVAKPMPSDVQPRRVVRNEFTLFGARGGGEEQNKTK